jgi:hypothetical protein
MATRGAIYKTAISAVKGHDNRKCIAVPERKSTSYTRHGALCRESLRRSAKAA